MNFILHPMLYLKLVMEEEGITIKKEGRKGEEEEVENIIPTHQKIIWSSSRYAIFRNS